MCWQIGWSLPALGWPICCLSLGDVSITGTHVSSCPSGESRFDHKEVAAFQEKTVTNKGIWKRRFETGTASHLLHSVNTHKPQDHPRIEGSGYRLQSLDKNCCKVIFQEAWTQKREELWSLLQSTAMMTEKAPLKFLDWVHFKRNYLASAGLLYQWKDSPKCGD